MSMLLLESFFSAFLDINAHNPEEASTDPSIVRIISIQFSIGTSYCKCEPITTGVSDVSEIGSTDVHDFICAS